MSGMLWPRCWGAASASFRESAFDPRILSPSLPLSHISSLEALTRYEGGWEPGIRTASLLVALGIQLAAMLGEQGTAEGWLCGEKPGASPVGLLF